MTPEKDSRNLTRWLLAAAVVLLALILALQLWQMFHAGPAAAGQSPTQDAGNASSQSVTPQSVVSPGKAAMIQAVQDQNAALSIEALSALSVEELEQLWEAGAPGLPIGLSAAIHAAEEYAGTLEVDAITYDADPELDESPAYYEVELHHVTLGSFSYEIDAYSGEVLKGIPNILQSSGAPSVSETGEPATKPQSIQPSAPETPAVQKPAAAAAQQPAAAVLSPSAQQPSASSAQPALIGEAAAKAAAFTHSGVQEADASQVRCKLDWEDGVQVYEIDFLPGGTEYDYEINATTGAVLKAEWDQNSNHGLASPQQPAASSGQTALIGEAAAKAAAFSHAGVQEANATQVKCKLDWEDGVQIYDVEFKVGRLEYEYEIDAATGTVLKAEIDD